MFPSFGGWATNCFLRDSWLVCDAGVVMTGLGKGKRRGSRSKVQTSRGGGGVRLHIGRCCAALMMFGVMGAAGQV